MARQMVMTTRSLKHQNLVLSNWLEQLAYEGRPYGDVGGRRESGVPTAGDKRQRYNPLSPPLWIPTFAGMTSGRGFQRTPA